MLSETNIFAHQIEAVAQGISERLVGQAAGMAGLTIEVADFPAPTGAMCTIRSRSGRRIAAQVVGFRADKTLLMPLSETAGVGRGDTVVCEASRQTVGVSEAMLGRVLNGLGQPVDGKNPLDVEQYYPLLREAPPAMSRRAIDKVLGTGIRAIDAMTTVGSGQRLGIFAGTGVGKSVLMGMISRYTSADVIVVALVGERGREVRDFLTKDLGPEGLERSVVVVSTSDESPVLRVRACFLATAVAEFFRDQGKDVLLLMDSLTRMAMAQRQIGLAAGEPPATKGYTPSVFAMLPQLLERSGRTERGSITGFYTVLVEGDDITEPIADTTRGILDGHVWLSRDLANRSHYPAISVLDSISRVMVDVVDEEHIAAARVVKRVMATWQDIEDLVNIGAYAAGTNPEFDLAVYGKPLIDRFLQQAIKEGTQLDRVRTDLVALAQNLGQRARQLQDEARMRQPAGVR
ncbi:MAG: FliI/YscN family ATPase [Phycisphaerae bacterium]|nr:FliI/YscN family ATPase [Phycisphaerae bacterium]